LEQPKKKFFFMNRVYREKQRNEIRRINEFLH
jgi:hypothetical protein